MIFIIKLTMLTVPGLKAFINYFILYFLSYSLDFILYTFGICFKMII